MLMPPALQFEEITKEYRSWRRGKCVRALQQFSLSVQVGEIFGFLGPNGAGKSTAIHLAAGFMRPTSGFGHMLGKPFGDAVTRRRVGFLAENVALYHRTAEAAIRFYGGLNGLHGAALDRALHTALQAVDLQSESARNLAQYSRGMLQRAGLAQALVNDPELLILDEPTSALDPASRLTVRNILLQAREAGKSVFLSSHLLSELEMVCDRIVVLNRGRVVLEGRTRDLLESYEQCEVVLRQARNFAVPPSAKDVTSNNGELRFNVPRQTQREVIEAAWSAGAEL